MKKTKSNRPDSLYLAPYWVRVIEDPAILEVAQVTGAALEDAQLIVVAEGNAPGIDAETVLHESLHHLWHQTALDRTYTDEQEEEVLWTLTPRILGLILDNREFVEWLYECRDKLPSAP